MVYVAEVTALEVQPLSAATAFKVVVLLIITGVVLAYNCDVPRFGAGEVPSVVYQIWAVVVASAMPTDCAP